MSCRILKSIVFAVYKMGVICARQCVITFLTTMTLHQMKKVTLGCTCVSNAQPGEYNPVKLNTQDPLPQTQVQSPMAMGGSGSKCPHQQLTKRLRKQASLSGQSGVQAILTVSEIKS